jgi:ribose transport system ATP-binding protein
MVSEPPAALPRQLLAVRNLSKSFYGVRVLHAVDIDVVAGEIHALLGQNGSGKSTLIKCLSGYHAPDAGAQLTVDGADVPLPYDPTVPRGLGLAFVHQQLGLAPNLTVLENLRVGGFTTGRAWRIRWRANEREVREVLARVGLQHVDPGALVGSLSAVERAMIAVARAFEVIETRGSGVLILDEATAYLPRDGVDLLFEAVERLAESGAGVLFVTHRLEEVRRLADRVTVLRDGELIATSETASLTDRELVELIVGRPMADLYPVPGDVRDDVLLAAKDAAGSQVESFSLRLHRGETLGVTGLVGMGQESVPYLLFGADSTPSGQIEIGGRSVDLRTMRVADAMAMGIGLVPADRLRHGGAGAATVRENITLATLREYFRWGRIDRRQERRRVLDLMRTLDVKPLNPDRQFAELSGGNQQKVVLAKWFLRRPDVLLLHEPTQGVDVGARQEVFRHIRSFTEGGGAVVISSTEYDDLARLCDRVIVFRDGRMVAELDGDALTVESVVEQVFVPLGADRDPARSRAGASVE